MTLIWELHYTSMMSRGLNLFGSFTIQLDYHLTGLLMLFFWWKHATKLIEDFKNIGVCNLKNGSSVLFWDDNLNNINLQLQSGPISFHLLPTRRLLSRRFL